MTASTIRAAGRSQAARGTLANPARDLRARQADAVAAVPSRAGNGCYQAGLHLARRAA